MRILFLGRRTQPQTNNRAISALPRHVLRRIIKRMRSFDRDLSLQSLANEIGYSRVHFVRMFRAATGYSPHNYLLNLKLERARELLKKPSMSLIDIALDCGFSSHCPARTLPTPDRMRYRGWLSFATCQPCLRLKLPHAERFHRMITVHLAAHTLHVRTPCQHGPGRASQCFGGLRLCRRCGPHL